MIIKPKRTKWIIIMALAGVVLAAGALTFFWIKNQDSNKLSSNQLPTVNQRDKAEKPTPEPIAIRLPNADPIYDVKAEYFAENGIWLLVNKTTPLPNQQYRPADLITPDVTTEPGRSQEEMSVRKIIEPDLKELFAAARADGIELMIGSAFRSYSLQNYYYTNYVRNSGEAEANRFSAKPGTSEHQLGLAIDFTTPAQVCRLQQCFEGTPAGQWLRDNAHKYGFILRYPKDGEPITGYIYEPWHFRYLGKDLATAFKKSGLATLEEAYPYIETARKALGE